ncbi:hypothetical protein C8A05DRAFT_33476 [Staphylotrichum tortipilum]|uniref:Uncharacterized protein n=1 Tax=Staphylotrichum tortipilum TaxID=2831512 RepID=A0AAN6MKY7_9PEZI|nr:hypothetical protein C8A05DRAFT_33476 [Staphylotrichum longicolle]
MATSDVDPSAPCSRVPDMHVSPNEGTAKEVLAPLIAKITCQLVHMIQRYPDAPAVFNAFCKTFDAARLALTTISMSLQGRFKAVDRRSLNYWAYETKSIENSTGASRSLGFQDEAGIQIKCTKTQVAPAEKIIEEKTAVFDETKMGGSPWATPSKV